LLQILDWLLVHFLHQFLELRAWLQSRFNWSKADAWQCTIIGFGIIGLQIRHLHSYGWVVLLLCNLRLVLDLLRLRLLSLRLVLLMGRSLLLATGHRLLNARRNLRRLGFVSKLVGLLRTLGGLLHIAVGRHLFLWSVFLLALLLLLLLWLLMVGVGFLWLPGLLLGLIRALGVSTL
jgi:hypothetical protein